MKIIRFHLKTHTHISEFSLDQREIYHDKKINYKLIMK